MTATATEPEQVLALPRPAFDRRFFRAARYVPLRVSDPRDEDRAVDGLLADCVALPRTPGLEADESFKQLVAYTTLRRRDARDTKFWLYRRVTHGGGEHRLLGALSLGVGGHVRRADHFGPWPPRRGALYRAAARELVEEIPGVAVRDLDLYGVVNDDASPVGRVHAGFAFAATVSDPETVRPARAEGVEPVGWFAARELWRLYEAGANFEAWSVGVLSALSEWSLGSGAGFRRVAP